MHLFFGKINGNICSKKAPTTGVAASELLFVYKRKEVTLMTDFEMIMVVLEIFGMLVSFGTALVVLLTYIDRKTEQKK